MRFILTFISAGGLLAAIALAQPGTSQPQPRYTVTDLGPAGNPFSQAASVNDFGLVTGFDTASNGYSHAVLWDQGSFRDISQPGLGGPNSGAGGANIFGLVMGGAETSRTDPNNENFCGYGTGLQCLACKRTEDLDSPQPVRSRSRIYREGEAGTRGRHRSAGVRRGPQRPSAART